MKKAKKKTVLFGDKTESLQVNLSSAPSPPPAPSLPPFMALPPQKSIMKKQQAESVREPPPRTSSSHLGNILSSSVLNSQKNRLKSTNRRFNAVTLDRRGLLENSHGIDYLNLGNSMEYLRTQAQTADVVSLHFSGTEQITDAFCFVWAESNIQLPNLKTILFSGCYNISDEGVQWLTQCFESIEDVDFTGCYKLTQKSLLNIIKAWASTVVSINMSGTNVSMIPQQYTGSLKLNGCPLISPTDKIYHDRDRRMVDKTSRQATERTCFKMVILTEKTLRWSPLAVLTKDANTRARNQLSVKINYGPIGNNYFNIFEVPIESGVTDLFVSPGCIVVLPYQMDAGHPSPAVALHLLSTIRNVMSKCPECLFMLLGLTDDEDFINNVKKDQGVTNVRSWYHGLVGKYRHNLRVKLGKLEDDLDKAIQRTITKKIVQRLANFHVQNLLSSGQTLATSTGRLTTQEDDHEALLSAVLTVGFGDRDLLDTILTKAVASLGHFFPWHNMAYQNELKIAMTAMEKLPFAFHSLVKVYEENVPDAVKAELSENRSFEHVGKICEVMSTMGKALYFPYLKDKPALTDFSVLERVYHQLFLQPAPVTITLRCMGSNIPCWTKAHLTSLAQGVKSEPDVLIYLLERQGLMIKFPRDLWSMTITETVVYILYKDIPDKPVQSLDIYWPEPIPLGETQCDRYFTFCPGLPDSFFPNLLRHCSKLGGIRLIWKQGVVIQRGPITVLIELMYNFDEEPVIIVSARLPAIGSAVTDDTGEHVLEDKESDVDAAYMTATWATLKIYDLIVRNLMYKYKIYAKVSIPCPECVKDDSSRYEIVKNQNAWQIPVELAGGLQVSGRQMTCRTDQASLHYSSTVGPTLLFKKIVPEHFYLGCLPDFSMFTRCMMCGYCGFEGPECEGNLKNGKTAMDCSCEREAQMCDKCGLCQRCVTFLSKIQMNLYPSFQEDGGVVSFSKSDAEHMLSQELSPNYCPVMMVSFHRGAHLDIKIQINSKELVFNTGDGVITIKEKMKQDKETQNPDWCCHEGQTVTVQLIFPTTDLDEMELVIRLQGYVIYTLPATTQSCSVSFIAKNPMFTAIALPQLKLRKEPGLDGFGQKIYCSSVNYSCTITGLQAKMLSAHKLCEDTLFQTGGVNYSGAAMLTLPSELSDKMIRFPSFQAIKANFTYHLLCYTRSKISDLMTVAMTGAIPESWNVYHMIHLVDAPGFRVDERKQREIDVQACHLMWAWHLLTVLKPEIILPKGVQYLLPAELNKSENTPEMTQILSGIHDLLWLSFWRICLKMDAEQILQAFQEVELMSTEAKVLKECTEANFDRLGVVKTVSKFNEENYLYLCPGHKASMAAEEGMSTVLPEVYGSYSIFLYSVDLPSNNLSRLPEETFSVLPNLKEFDCSNNYLEEIPASIGNCKSLYSLGLNQNNLTDLPASLEQCKQLFRLEISNNMFQKIPDVVVKLTSLKRLYCSHMMLTSLPEDIGNLENLEKLYINNNCFTSLPSSFRKLTNLDDLGISGVPWLSMVKNKVVSFETFVKFLDSRNVGRWLDVNTQNQTELFKNFDEDSNGTLNVQELGKLNAFLFNLFPRFGYKGQEPPDDDTPSGFPEEICSLVNLQYLNMYYQGFTTIPAGIQNLTQLKILNLSHNPNLLSLPAEMGSISTLQRLELEQVPLLKTPPKEIRQKGFASTFAYLQRLQSGSSPCKRTKLMMVGLGGAGKTSLVKALLSDKKKADLTHGEAITDGIDICTWTVRKGEDEISYSVWDFAGQTVYYNTHQFFLSNRAVYLLLWNVRLGYEHAGLDFWLSSISVQAPKAPIFVVGSHIDQVSKFELPINEMRQRYRQIAGFHFVSSFTGEGIANLQEQLFEVTLQQEYMGEKIPDVWLTFEKSVTSARGTSNVVDYTEVERKANNSGIFEKSEVYQAVQFLHDLGSLQHFTTEFLKSKVVINPQWIVDVMACVVSVKNSAIKNGRLQHKDISKVWQDYPTELHSWLLRLTEEYDLTFPLENQSVNLVPCLLPEIEPEFTWPELDKSSTIKENKMIYKFDYLPAGLFNRGQVRLHQLSDSATIWKKGSLLNKNGHRALIKQTRDSELIVVVQGPRPENVLFLVHEVFEGLIAESFRGVTYDFLLPCPDCLRMVVKDPHMFKSSTIRRALALKAPFLQCVKYFHTISCVDLLACMPPDSHTDFDVHLVQSVRSLRDLRKDLAADIFISYCSKDAPAKRDSVIHPASVCEDLKSIGYKCWFPVESVSYSMEDMARALTDASVFVAFMSTDYAENEDCANIFKYARITLKKPMVVIAVGDGFGWQQSKLGIHLADEVFVNMTKSKLQHYDGKFKELVKALEERTNRKTGAIVAPSCFFSYTWVNSAEAVAAGTRSVPGAVGYADPRELKSYLENHGVKCWIDVERVGMNGLFDDIAEGLLSAKVVVVCVSDEYADSPNCQIEFRYAANTLKLPIVMAVVGKGQKWRASEVGVLSLGYPLISFQEKSDTAHDTLLRHVKEALVKAGGDNEKEKKNKENEENKNLSFQELFELAQRKLLRQLMLYAEHQDTAAYPRLFMVDFLTGQSDSEDSKSNIRPRSRLVRAASRDSHVMAKRLSDLKTGFRMQAFCVHVLCEHEEGWHSVSEPIPLAEDFGVNLLEKFSPFLARMSAIAKYNKQLHLNLNKCELGQNYMKWLDEIPEAAMSDYQNVYHEFRQIVIEADVQRDMGKLARCRLPNGKTIWLCEKHRTLMRVTVLSNEIMDTGHKGDTDSAATDHLLTGLRVLDPSKIAAKFSSSQKAKRIAEDPNQAGKQKELEDKVKLKVEQAKTETKAVAKETETPAVVMPTETSTVAKAAKDNKVKDKEMEDIERKDRDTEKSVSDTSPFSSASIQGENSGMKLAPSDADNSSRINSAKQRKMVTPQKKSLKQQESSEFEDPQQEVSEHALRRSVQRQVSSANLTRSKSKTCSIM